jgi:hypothetical protein
VTSAINYISIDENFPYPGQDNDTQTFRDNFDTIKQSLSTAKDEITDLQDNSAKLNNDNDFSLNIIQNAVLQNNRDQKFDGGLVTASPTTVDYENGPYQIYNLGADVTMDFLNFPGDPVFTAETTPIGVGKVTLEIYGNGGASTLATAIEMDNTYRITSLGTSDFTDLGAATNTVGTLFTATADGSGTSGTGTATLVRKLNFQVSGSTVIKKDANFPSTITVEQADDPIFIEVWRHSSSVIFMRYLGLFSE